MCEWQMFDVFNIIQLYSINTVEKLQCWQQIYSSIYIYTIKMFAIVTYLLLFHVDNNEGRWMCIVM